MKGQTHEFLIKNGFEPWRLHEEGEPPEYLGKTLDENTGAFILYKREAGHYYFHAARDINGNYTHIEDSNELTDELRRTNSLSEMEKLLTTEEALI